MSKGRGTRSAARRRGSDAGGADARRRVRSVESVRRQIDDIYLQLDSQMTRHGQILLQLDAVRSKTKLL